MHLHRPKQPVCVAIGCSGVALVFQLVAVAGTGWLMFKGDYLLEQGLFRACARSQNICSAYDYVKNWAKACQAFSILALGTTFCSCVLGILHILREETQALTRLAAGVNAIAAVYIAVEVGVFAGETMDLVTNTTFTVSYGYGFYLSIVAGVLSVAAALFYIVGRAPVRQ
ncbi:uncharacterized protein LOC112562961 [Pomacea canaliculata]|nr:uncharacterized protein LOC112562961 [Pomacea canaliculata]